MPEIDQKASGLSHRIQNGPEDVLRIIFDYTTLGDARTSFHEATTISHVCKFWREVVIRMSSLWTYVSISMKDNVDDVTLSMERTRARLGVFPVNIEINDIGDISEDGMKRLMESIKLNKFKAISTITYSFKSLQDLNHFEDSSQSILPESATHIGVQVSSRYLGSSSWDCSHVLNQVTSLISLELNVHTVITLGDTRIYSSLRKFNLVAGSVPSLSQQLHRFPKLKELRINSTMFYLDPLQLDINMPELQILEVYQVQEFPWDKISAPRLLEVQTDDTRDTSINFVCRHPQVTRIIYDDWIQAGDFDQLARSLVNVKYLDIRGEVQGLYSNNGTTAPFPPFPKLEQLVVHRHDLAIMDFDDLLRACFFPPEGVRILSKLHISTPPIGPVPQPWHTSKLSHHFRTTTRPHERKPYRLMVTLALK